jgi:phosphate:Na+ symporter
VSVSAGVLPILSIGAFLWLIAKGRTRSLGAILAGYGLLFIGIEYLQTGMKGISWNLDAVGGSGFGWQWILAGIGILMSIIMQSWGAVAATTLVEPHAGSLTFCQACAMIVWQSVRAAATSAMVAIGRGLAVRRAALAHIVYNVSIGVLGILLLGPIRAAAGWVGSRLDDPEGVLALAAFSSIFKFLGFLAFYPWLDRFPRLIIVISGTGSQSAVNRLAPILGEAGRAVALEAGWRATLELALGSVDAVRRRLTGEVVRYDPPVEAVRQIENFLESPSLETTDLSTFEPRLIWLSHALDHLRQLHDDFTRVLRAVGDWHTSAGFEAGGALAD